MPKYHPDSQYLNDYAAGTLDRGNAVVVSAHLEYCSECRAHVQQLQQLGSVLFEQATENSKPMNNADELLASIMQKIDGDADTQNIAIQTNVAKAPQKTHDLPRVLRKLTGGSLDNLLWKKLTRKLSYSQIPCGDNVAEVGLYNILAGGKIPEHKHQGDEVTLVLKGSFSDADDIYQEGDFIVRKHNEVHQPIATEDEDCLCLTAVQQPIAFTGWMRLFNPFLRVKPS